MAEDSNLDITNAVPCIYCTQPISLHYAYNGACPLGNGEFAVGQWYTPYDVDGSIKGMPAAKQIDELTKEAGQLRYRVRMLEMENASLKSKETV